MADIVRTVDIAATAEQIFDRLSDFAAISSWADNVDHSCFMSGQTSGVGTVRRVQAGRNVVVERVLAWEPPTTLSYELEGLPPLVKVATNTWHVYPVGDGCRVTLTSHVETGDRPPQKAAAKAIGRALGKASDQMLEGLKRSLA